MSTRLLLLLCCVTLARAQGMSSFIGQLFGTPSDQRQAIVDSLLADLPLGETPIREDGTAWFVAWQTASQVQVAGDMTGWSPELSLNQMGGTNFWFANFDCANDARLDYKFVINNSSWILDPHNPHTVSGGFGPNSELAMPDYVQPVEIQDYGYPECEELLWEDVHSEELGNARDIRILLPPGHDPGSPARVLVVHDGHEYLGLGSLREVLAWMAVHRPGIRLPVCVCIPPVNRTAEYENTNRADFVDFVMQTVLPMVREEVLCSEDPADWGQMGASSGGSISGYFLGAHPEVFSKGILMSPHLPQTVYNGIQERTLEDLRLYLNWGSYDIPSLLPLIASFNAMIDERGIPNVRQEYAEGHSWGLWRATIVEGLEAVWPAESSLDEGRLRPDALELRAWPNPFNGSLSIKMPRSRAGHVEIYNLLGERVQVLKGEGPLLRWHPAELASGSYWLVAPGLPGVDARQVLYLR